MFRNHHPRVSACIGKIIRQTKYEDIREEDERRRSKEEEKKKKKRKNDFIRPIHSNSLSTRRISGVIRRYRARQDSWFPGESRHWNEISKRSNDILRYLKSLLCTSTSYERREGSWEWPRSFWIMGTIRSLDVREARRHCAPSLRGNRSIEGGEAKKLKAFRKGNSKVWNKKLIKTRKYNRNLKFRNLVPIFKWVRD